MYRSSRFVFLLFKVRVLKAWAANAKSDARKIRFMVACGGCWLDSGTILGESSWDGKSSSSTHSHCS